MLADVNFKELDPLSELLKIMISDSSESPPVSPGRHPQTGIYFTNWFNFEYEVEENLEVFHNTLPITYGVCDTPEQVLLKMPQIEQSEEHKYVIAFTPVLKSEQSPTGGWRWHKWGPYIGTHTPQHEYLYDEEGIEVVLVFHIYRLID